MKHILFALFFATFFISCNKEKGVTPENFDLGTETNFRAGDEYLSGIQSLQFRITEVNDSRCPSDVVCVWQGEAVVRIEVELPEEGTLWLSTYDNQKDTLGAYSFELVEVAPYPVSTETIKFEDYDITLKIEELE